jgi:hypothetical protein
MHKIGACVLIGAFAAAIAPASPSLAFGLRIGPFHIGLPLPPHRYGHGRHVALQHSDTGVADARENTSAAPRGGQQATEPAAFYSTVALPGIFDEVFTPAAAPAWPFGFSAPPLLRRPSRPMRAHVSSPPTRRRSSAA